MAGNMNLSHSIFTWRIDLLAAMSLTSSPWTGRQPRGSLHGSVRHWMACCRRKVAVEVKYSFLCKDRSFADVAAEKGAFCLEQVAGSWRLRRNHAYYAQVQTPLFATQAKCCDFVVGSPAKTHVKRISPNICFISTSAEVLSKLYIEHMLPILSRQA